MPRMVDVDERRAELIEATCQVIARQGLANVTLRSVARVGGWTTGIVSHYFADKQALLMATYESRADRARLHLEHRLLESTPLLDACVDATLPLDDERMLDWQVYLAFMGSSIGEPDLAALFRRRQASFLTTLTEAFEAEVAAGRIAATIDNRHEAERLLAVINGISMQAVLAPFDWPAARQQAALTEHLASITRSASVVRRRRLLVEAPRRTGRRTAGATR